VAALPRVRAIGETDEQSQAEKRELMNQHKQKRRDDRLHDKALETYINSISDLLLDKGLSILAKQNARGMLDTEQQDLLDAGIDVIRARTLSIFRRFTDYKDSNRTDGQRKGNILIFLYETGLIRDQKVNDQGQEETEPKQIEALLSLFHAGVPVAFGPKTTLRNLQARSAH